MEDKNLYKNEFQIWLNSQGYYRKEGSLVWYIADRVVSGKELSDKLNEFKNKIKNRK